MYKTGINTITQEAFSLCEPLCVSFRRPVVDYTCWFLFLLSSGLVEHDVVRGGLACSRPGWCNPGSNGPAAGHIFGTQIRFEVGQTVWLGRCYFGCDGPSCYSAQSGYCESDVSSRQPLCQGCGTWRSCTNWISWDYHTWYGGWGTAVCTFKWTWVRNIQRNLGRHVALHHMELAQLWRCPVTCVRSGKVHLRTASITWEELMTFRH